MDMRNLMPDRITCEMNNETFLIFGRCLVKCCQRWLIVGWTFLISAFCLSTFQWSSWWRPMPSPSTTSGSSLSLFNSWAFFTFSLFKIGHSYMCTKLFASIYKLFLVTLAQQYQPSTHKNVNFIFANCPEKSNLKCEVVTLREPYLVSKRRNCSNIYKALEINL